MKKRLYLSAAGVLVLISLIIAQLDLKEKAQLLGIQVEEKPGATEQEKLTDVSFIFIDQPSAYYHNKKDSLLTIDFYDAILSEEKLPTIEQSPFMTSRITQTKIDVNKDIEGLAPEMKDIVRIDFIIEKDIEIDLTLTDDFNVITLSTVWTKGGKLVTKKTTKKSRAWMYVVGGIVGITAGTIGYIFATSEPPPPGTSDTSWNPPPPDLPNIP